MAVNGLLALNVLLTISLIFTVRWAFGVVENTCLLAAQERDALSATHVQQLSEFANRIQVPDRAAHMSVAEFAPDSEPFIHPDVEEELELNGES